MNNRVFKKKKKRTDVMATTSSKKHYVFHENRIFQHFVVFVTMCAEKSLIVEKP